MSCLSDNKSKINYGAYNRLIYDPCAYAKKLQESVSPLEYRLYEGNYENCNKCTHENKFWRPFDVDVVDIESELKNITRPNSKCPTMKYNPNCKKSKTCINTFEKAPVILDKQICPVVTNNITRLSNPGYSLPKPICN